MFAHARPWWGLALALNLVSTRPALAQMHHHTASVPDSTHHHAMPDSSARHGAHSDGAAPAVMHHHDMEGMDRAQGTHTMDHHGHMAMSAMYGPYPMTREASGTAWQPDRAPHRGLHAMRGSWMLMLHGSADVVLDQQGGPRGDDKVFSSNMVMGMAQRMVGPGTLGLRTMLSAEPATIGKKGYPLLLQTGETGDGRIPLIDRRLDGVVLFDIGGGSSEIIWIDIDGRGGVRQPKLKGWISLPVGVVTLSERHGGVRVTRQGFEDMVSDVVGMVSGYKSKHSVTVQRDDGSRVTYVIDRDTSVPDDLDKGSRVTLHLSAGTPRVVRSITLVSRD